MDLPGRRLRRRLPAVVMTFDDADLPRAAAPRASGSRSSTSPLRVEVNPLTGAVSSDDRLAGASPADEAALEYALRLADRWGWDVVVATTGNRRCEPMLRAALACGATRAVRVDLAPDAAAPIVAAALLGGPRRLRAGGLRGPQPRRRDRVGAGVPRRAAGSGAGAGVGAARCPGHGAACRLSVAWTGDAGSGCAVSTPAVVSVEPGGLRLRRATLPAVLRARTCRSSCCRRRSRTTRTRRSAPAGPTARGPRRCPHRRALSARGTEC